MKWHPDDVGNHEIGRDPAQQNSDLIRCVTLCALTVSRPSTLCVPNFQAIGMSLRQSHSEGGEVSAYQDDMAVAFRSGINITGLYVYLVVFFTGFCTPNAHNVFQKRYL